MIFMHAEILFLCKIPSASVFSLISDCSLLMSCPERTKVHLSFANGVEDESRWRCLRSIAWQNYILRHVHINDKQSNTHTHAHTCWSGWEFRALISKKLNVVSTCCHGYNSTEESLAGEAKENVTSCEMITCEREKKNYLRGNLWRQEIKTPCRESLKKRRRRERSQTQTESRWQEKGK